MIRIDFSEPPQAWHEIRLPLDDELVPVRVCYRLLSTDEVNDWNLTQYRLAKQAELDRAGALDTLIEKASPEQLAAQRALLRAHLLDWDIIDAQSGEKAPINDQTLDALFGRSAYFAALLRGLYEASGPEAARKNA